MQNDNIRVSRKLWGAFVGLMIAMLLMSAWAQNRSNSAMARALEEVVEIEGRWPWQQRHESAGAAEM